jgi:hypothetical protein
MRAIYPLIRCKSLVSYLLALDVILIEGIYSVDSGLLCTTKRIRELKLFFVIFSFIAHHGGYSYCLLSLQ